PVSLPQTQTEGPRWGKGPRQPAGQRDPPGGPGGRGGRGPSQERRNGNGHCTDDCAQRRGTLERRVDEDVARQGECAEERGEPVDGKREIDRADYGNGPGKKERGARRNPRVGQRPKSRASHARVVLALDVLIQRVCARADEG